jgi:guanosine-3',5'-bis(diphosphate) 3'-pyrophosphohydrolase
MAESKKEIYQKTLLKKVKERNPYANLDFIKKGIEFSYDAHDGQKRASGEEYFIHCFEIAMILSDMQLDSHTIVASLLHDVIEDTNIKPEVIEKEFDKETLDLVLGVTKLKQIDKKIDFDEDLKEERAENIRKVFLATAKDVRVIIIKLIDRLHNMRTLKHLPEHKQKIISKETMEIYAPIAHKLGMYFVKAELEDLSFRYLEPKIYQSFKNKISKKKEQRDKEVSEIIENVKQLLKENHIKAEIYGRAKHFYSIYKKITKDKKEFNEIYDLNAIRIITESIEDCYKTLGIVHKIWKPMPKRFKDYIAVPKSNGYQSLHTTVVGTHGRILEVQIRTKDMHLIAEEGIASHWRYKEEEQDKKFDRQIEWLKQVLDWKKSSDASDFIESLKVDLFAKEIFVFTPKGDPISLPDKATPIDFAYAVHTAIGNKCKQAKVNGKVIPLDYKLSAGDIVEIITSKNSTPSRSWLAFVQSSSTKAKIKKELNIAVDNTAFKKRKEEQTNNIKTKFQIKEESIIYDGKKYQLKIPKCCNPKITDNIKAFKVKDGKIIIHKADCMNIYVYDKKNEIDINVKKEEELIKNIRIDVKDKVGILSEILNTTSKEGFNIKRVNSRFGKDGRVIIILDLIEPKNKKVGELIDKVKKIDCVLDVMIDEI